MELECPSTSHLVPHECAVNLSEAELTIADTKFIVVVDVIGVDAKNVIAIFLDEFGQLVVTFFFKLFHRFMLP